MTKMKQAKTKQAGFTLLEVLLVVIIISILAGIALPRLSASADLAREKADITTGREVKAALDRFQIEKGYYPRLGELNAQDGKVIGEGFIPGYIKKLDPSVTQQVTREGSQGFGIGEWRSGQQYPDPDRLVMIYLSSDGQEAEVRVFDKSLTRVLWSSD